jgi:YedE family putative selenium metabolism protein
MLRGEGGAKQWGAGSVLAAMVGVAAAWLVLLGNPGNMGICGACFLRDIAASLGFTRNPAPAIFRPEIVGLLVGALAWRLASRQYAARSGSHAATRFAFGILMGFAAMVFLGCPFRMLQRLGGGDLNAWIGLVGFIAGVRVGMLFEARGYSVGKTSEVTAPVGFVGTLAFVAVLVLFSVGGLLIGPGPNDISGPPHAPWLASLTIASAAGAALSATGFCAILAARQIFLPKRRMLLGACALVVGYAVVIAVMGKLNPGFDAQPAAHGDWVWNILAASLLGLTGVLAGGCPVRQVIMAGEGNGDGFVTAMGILVGGALAHNLGIVSSPAGTTNAGRIAVGIGLAVAVVYAAAVTRLNGKPSGS